MLIFGVTFFMSCEKDSIPNVNEANQSVEQTSFNKAAGFPIKVRKGTHIERLDCTKNLPCGPCPGICIRWEKPADPELLASNYELTQDDIDNNLSLVYLQEINSSSFLISVTDGEECYNENLLIFDEDIDLGSNVAAGFGYNSLTILAGEYSVDYSNNPEGEITVNVVSN